MKFDDIFGCIEVDVTNIDLVREFVRPDVLTAFDGITVAAAVQAAADDPTPVPDRSNVVDMMFRRRGVRRAFNTIAATSFPPGCFDRFNSGDGSDAR